MSLSDFSDLTELSSSEDEHYQPATKSKKSKKEPKQYTVTNVLRPPRTTQYTAKSLYDQIIDNSIDLDPEYQREVVWNVDKQTGLIDSILRNYYIPPIIFAVSTQDDGSELRTCIDGKQRLTSIQRFIDGQIPHKDSYTNEKVWYKASASHPKGKVLPAPLRAIFANKQIVCVEYSDLNDDQEREIFQRVQLGVALTPAERLQAIVGPWPTVIRDIQSQILGEEGFEGYLDWGHARGRDFQCLATIGYLIENYPKQSIPNPKGLEKWLHGTVPVKKSLIVDLQDTFRIFLILARDKRYSGSFDHPTRVSPIEFVMTGVLIYLKRSSLSLTQLSSAIEQMRKDVRATEKDIRSNTRVTKLMFEFMNKRLKVSGLKKDGKGDIPATIAARELKPSAKRKRPPESDDESESEPPPRKVSAAKSSNSTAAKTASKSTKQAPAKKTSPPTVTAAAATKTQSAVSRKSTAATTSAESSKQSTPKPSARPTPKLPAKQPIPRPPAPVVDSTTKQTPEYQPPAPQPPRALSKASHSSSISIARTIKAEPMVPSFPAPSQSPSVQSPVTQSSFMDRLAPIRAAKAALVGSDGGTQSNQVAQPSTPVSSSFGQPHLLTNGSSGALLSSSGNPVHPLPPKPSTSGLQPSQHPPQPPPPQHPPPPQYPPPPQHPPPQYPPPPQHLSLQCPPPSVPRLAQPPLPPQAPGYPPIPTQTPVQQQSSGSFQGSHALPPRPPPTGPSFLAQQHALARADSPASSQSSYSHALPARPIAPSAPAVPHRPPPPRASSIGGSYPESDRRSYSTAPERRQSLDERRPTGGYDGSGRGWERGRDSGLDWGADKRRSSWGRERDLPPHQRGGHPGRGRGRLG